MILFSQRNKLGKLFEKWANKNNVLNCPLNMVSWLESLDLLNEEKVKRYLKEKK